MTANINISLFLAGTFVGAIIGSFVVVRWVWPAISRWLERRK